MQQDYNPDHCPVVRGEEVELGLFALTHFVEAWEDGTLGSHPDMMDELRYFTAVLWLTSGEVDKGAPKLLEALVSAKGVTYSKIVSLIPAFLKHVEPLIERRTDRELGERVPLSEEEIPF